MGSYPNLEKGLMSNPHIAYLKRQPGCLSAQRTWCACITVMGLLGMILIVPILVLPAWGIVMGLLLALFLAPISLMLPAIIGTMTAANTATNIQSVDYELIMLTPLRNRTLAWGYFYVGVWRVRTFITSLLGVTMISTTMMVVGFLLFPNWQDEPEVIIRLTVGLLALGLQLIGLCLLAVSSGVALAVWTRSTLGLSMMMPILLLIVVATFQYGTCIATLEWSQPDTNFGIAMGLAVVAPYILTGLCLWATNAGVRRSRS